MTQYFLLGIFVTFGVQYCPDYAAEGDIETSRQDDASKGPHRPLAKGKVTRPAKAAEATRLQAAKRSSSSGITVGFHAPDSAAAAPSLDRTARQTQDATFRASNAPTAPEPVTLKKLQHTTTDDRAIIDRANKKYESAWFAKEHRTQKYIANFKELPNEVQAVLMDPSAIAKLSVQELCMLRSAIELHENMQAGKDGGTLYSGERSGTLVSELSRLHNKVTLQIRNKNTQDLLKDPKNVTIKPLSAADLSTMQTEITKQLKSLSSDQRSGAKRLQQELTELQKRVTDRQALLKRQQERNAVAATPMTAYMDAANLSKVVDPKAEVIQKQIADVTSIAPQTDVTREEIAQLKQELANYHEIQLRRAVENAQFYQEKIGENMAAYNNAKTAAQKAQLSDEFTQLTESLRKANDVTARLTQKATAAQQAAAA